MLQDRRVDGFGVARQEVQIALGQCCLQKRSVLQSSSSWEPTPTDATLSIAKQFSSVESLLANYRKASLVEYIWYIISTFFHGIDEAFSATQFDGSLETGKHSFHSAIHEGNRAELIQSIVEPVFHFEINK